MGGTVLVFLGVVCGVVIGAQEQDYYWKEYFGTIPPDAFIAGRSIDGQNIYIGQAFAEKPANLKPGKITPGVQTVQIAHWTVLNVDRYIKILCGPQKNFHWVTITATPQKIAELKNQTVIGGYEFSIGIIYIGRLSIEGQVELGKVHSDGSLLYIHNNKIGATKNFEILTCRSALIDPRAGF